MSSHGRPHYEEYTAISQLNPQLNTVNVKMIVIETQAAFRLQNGDMLQTLKVGDPTGCVNLTLRLPDTIEVFQPSDILRLKSGFVSIHRGSLTLNAGRNSEIFRIGDFMLGFTETPNLSEYKAEWAALERQRKGSPPEEGEVTGDRGIPMDPRRTGRGNPPGSKRYPPVGPPGGPPPKRIHSGDPRNRP